MLMISSDIMLKNLDFYPRGKRDDLPKFGLGNDQSGNSSGIQVLWGLMHIQFGGLSVRKQ